MSGSMDCFGVSDIGRQRSSNEDHFLIADVCKSMRVHQTNLGLDHQSRLFGEKTRGHTGVFPFVPAGVGTSVDVVLFSGLMLVFKSSNKSVSPE